MAQNPTSLGTLTNSLFQIIEFYEHPTQGDSYPIICVCHDIEMAHSSDYAGLWICNGVYLMVNSTHHLIGFTINAKGEIIAIAEDENESPIYITI